MALKALVLAVEFMLLFKAMLELTPGLLTPALDAQPSVSAAVEHDISDALEEFLPKGPRAMRLGEFLPGLSLRP
jgi:hypothetical protein